MVSCKRLFLRRCNTQAYTSPCHKMDPMTHPSNSCTEAHLYEQTRFYWGYLRECGWRTTYRNRDDPKVAEALKKKKTHPNTGKSSWKEAASFELSAQLTSSSTGLRNLSSVVQLLIVLSPCLQGAFKSLVSFHFVDSCFTHLRRVLSLLSSPGENSSIKKKLQYIKQPVWAQPSYASVYVSCLGNHCETV